jgi:hypothetical protein
MSRQTGLSHRATARDAIGVERSRPASEGEQTFRPSMVTVQVLVETPAPVSAPGAGRRRASVT